MLRAHSGKWTYGNKLTAALSKKRIHCLDSLDQTLQGMAKGPDPVPPVSAQPQSQEYFLYFLMVGGKNQKKNS